MCTKIEGKNKISLEILTKQYVISAQRDHSNVSTKAAV